MFWVQVDHFATIVIATFIIHLLEEAEAYSKRKLMEAKIKTTKQNYVAGSVRKTRHFSSKKVIVASNCQQSNENFKQEFTPKL
jgi:hypothetical protein